MQTTEVKVGPPKNPRHPNSLRSGTPIVRRLCGGLGRVRPPAVPAGKARASQHTRPAGQSAKTEERHGFLESTVRGGWKREHAQALPPIDLRFQTLHAQHAQRKRQRQSEEHTSELQSPYVI